MRIDFHGSAEPTLGVEWEFALVDRRTRDLRNDAAHLFARAKARLENPARLHKELLKNTVEVVTGRYDDLERPAQVGHRLRDVGADAGDDLDGVLEELLVHPRRVRQPRLGPGEQVRGVVAEVAGTTVDQRELPLHAESRLGRAVEVDAHAVRVSQRPPADRRPVPTARGPRRF